MSDTIRSDRAPAPVGAYPHARRVGNLLFLSGIGSRVPGTNEIPGNVVDAAGVVVAHDIVKQTHQVLANIKTILEDAGSSLEEIVDITVFLTDMRNDFPGFNQVYAQYFTTNQPTRTTVEVGALPTPIAIELKVISALGTRLNRRAPSAERRVPRSTSGGGRPRGRGRAA